MALETLSANELLNFIIYDTISATPFATSACNVDNSSGNATITATATATASTTTSNVNNFSLDSEVKGFGSAVAQVVVGGCGGFENISSMVPPPPPPLPPPPRQQHLSVVQGRKKRRRRQRVCKNKEEAENQRMTHIAVERNRRKQMNEHLAVLRALMPESYVQRGDQASIVGGAIEFVKELEHHLQALEAQKIQLMQQQAGGVGANDNPTTATATAAATGCATTTSSSPFAQFFAYPQFTCSSSSSSSSSSAGQLPLKFTSSSKAAVADIEVTLIETHANVRILSRRRVRQLSKLVTGLQSMCLSILHLNVTTLDPLVLYSISAKVEEGCLLNSADDIAAAVHHILRIIEEEAHLCCQA